MSTSSTPRIVIIIGIIVVTVLALYLILRWVVQIASPMPDNLGVQNGRLMPCPDSPNCVSSFTEDAEHRIDPLTYSATREAAHEALLNVIADMPRSEIVTAEPNYIHAVFRSPTMGFYDDGEFLFAEEADRIHVRMAARLGRDDLDANRKRVEAIRAALAAELAE